jgi:hypothetical protein
MVHPRTGEDRSSENRSSSETDASPTAVGGDAGAACEVAFSEAGGAAVSALLNLLRLMGAELVLMRADCDPARFEQAVRAKIGQFPSPTGNEQAREAGLAHARHLVEQVLMQVRAQAALKKSLGPNAARRPGPAASAPKSPAAKLLN